MSRSPIKADVVAEPLFAYQQGWAALNQLIGEGRSFSGNERNCAFLNTRVERFATVSSISGLDFPQDGRAVAAADWDFDGRVDFWLTNRNAPRVRFLRNETASPADYLLLSLKGVEANRDAIGARVEVSHPVRLPAQVFTLRAGEGFLAQSSKWLHIGLGTTHDMPVQVTVHWPGGEAETFEGLQPRQRYALVQGSGKAVVPTLTMPRVQWGAPSVDAPKEDPMRTWIIGRVPLPPLEGVAVGNGNPVLLNLWSNDCAACASELAEWTQEADALQQAGLTVLTVSVDSLAGNDNTTLLDRIQPPFERLNATPEMIEALEAVHRSVVELRRPLPVPTSFLIDGRGRVAAIYKGRVRASQLQKDTALLKATLIDQREAAVPYPGQWASTPFPPNPMRIAAQWHQAERRSQAIDYLKHFLAGARHYLEDQYGEPEDHLAIVVDTHAYLGDLLIDEPDGAPQAARVYRNLLQLAANDTMLHKTIGERLLRKDLASDALAHLNLVLETLPNDATTLFNAGLAARSTNNPEAAVAHFQRYIRQRSDDLGGHYQLALAWQQRGRIEDAKEAVTAGLARPGAEEDASLRLLLQTLMRELSQE